ncbi:hypothetical protein AAC387_Pa04g0704 [Persea americana]
MLGLVISVVEDNCNALMALGRAGELFKGRRLQGFALMLLFSLLAISISLAFSFMMGEMEQNTVAWLLISNGKHYDNPSLFVETLTDAGVHGALL